MSVPLRGNLKAEKLLFVILFVGVRTERRGGMRRVNSPSLPASPLVFALVFALHFTDHVDLIHWHLLRRQLRGSRAYEISATNVCISMSRGWCYLPIYYVAFGALTGNTQSVSHQLKFQYLLTIGSLERLALRSRVSASWWKCLFPAIVWEFRYIEGRVAERSWCREPVWM